MVAVDYWNNWLYRWRHPCGQFRLEQGRILHRLTHQVRDVQLQIRDSTSLPPSSESLLRQYYNDKLGPLLQETVQLFRLYIPKNIELWASLRVRLADDHFHTLVRRGQFNHNRQESSQPINAQTSQTFQQLHSRCKDGICVLITGANLSRTMWEPQPNDIFGEDSSVLIGAVFSKSWNEQMNCWENKEISWILGISANTVNVFNKTHEPLMQMCTDHFSVLSNEIKRKYPSEYVQSQSPQSIDETASPSLLNPISTLNFFAPVTGVTGLVSAKVDQ
jgi:hypothetical protein